MAMTELSFDSGVASRVIERGGDEGLFGGSVPASALRTVTEVEGNEIRVSEGLTEKSGDVRAVSLMSLALTDPEWFRETLVAEAPNNGQTLWEQAFEGNTDLVNCTTPEVYENRISACRTRGYVEAVGLIAEKLTTKRQENYAFRVYRSLAQSERRLGIGTNPIGEVNQFFIAREGPTRVAGDHSDGESTDPDEEATDAASDDWASAEW